MNNSVLEVRTHNHFTALWNLSGTTRVIRSQKKHSPTHTHRGHQSFLFAFSIYYHPLHPPYSIHVLYSLSTISPSFLWSASWPGTLHFILHTFLHPIIVIFSQHKVLEVVEEIKDLGAFYDSLLLLCDRHVTTTTATNTIVLQLYMLVKKLKKSLRNVGYN